MLRQLFPHRIEESNEERIADDSVFVFGRWEFGQYFRGDWITGRKNLFFLFATEVHV